MGIEGVGGGVEFVVGKEEGVVGGEEEGGNEMELGEGMGESVEVFVLDVGGGGVVG